jgi:hypothetical protein
MITVVESKAKKTRGGTHGTKTFMAKVTCLWSEITVNLLEQYVLSGKLVVVHRHAPRGASNVPQVYHYIRIAKSLLGSRSTLSEMSMF